MTESIENIVLIGAGNVATILGQALHEQGLQIAQVYNRTLAKAKGLARQLSSDYTDQLAEINTEADLYILCVSDHAIANLAEKLAFLNQQDSFVVHTSGATPGYIFQDHFSRFGVFYPLQSFSHAQVLELSSVPFCVDAKVESDLQRLEQLAARLSKRVFRISDEQRSLLHLAAVFVNNFSNHLYDLMDQWLAEEQIPFELLQPLILGGAQKVQFLTPQAAQTGPAIRGDVNTIKRHLQILTERRPELLELYQQFTQSINPKLPFSKEEGNQ